MKSFKILFVLCVFSIISPVFCWADDVFYTYDTQQGDSTHFSVDGPYVLYFPDGTVRVISVNSEGRLIDTTYSIPGLQSIPVISHEGKYCFDVKLHPVKRQNWDLQTRDSVVVLSDPHGNLEYFAGTLKASHVINDDYEWTFGQNHLIVIGDVFDRGDDVLPILWLIYKLEDEAEKVGGCVSFLLGNHESMVLSGDLRYVNEKYIKLADQLNVNHSELFNINTELGHWLATRNTIQVVGENLYVHAGLSEMLVEQGITIQQINEEISNVLFLNKEDRANYSTIASNLLGSKGPLWYRGMVLSDEKYVPLSSDNLESILAAFKVKRVIVGHTIMDDISTFFEEQVVGINVDNKKNYREGRGMGILIIGNVMSVINAH